MHKQFNPELPGELAINLPFQSRPMIVTGIGSAVLEQAEAVQALDRETPTRSIKLSKAVIQAPEQPQAIYTEPAKRDKIAQYFADGKLRKFDKAHGTDLYSQKLEQRRKSAVFLMASEVGLFDSESIYYKRQLKNLTKV